MLPGDPALPFQHLHMSPHADRCFQSPLDLTPAVKGAGALASPLLHLLAFPQHPDQTPFCCTTSGLRLQDITSRTPEVSNGS